MMMNEMGISIQLMPLQLLEQWACKFYKYNPYQPEPATNIVVSL